MGTTRIVAFNVLVTLFLCSLLMIPAGDAEGGIIVETDKDSYEPGDTVKISVFLLEDGKVSVIVRNPKGKVILLESNDTDDGNSSFTFSLTSRAREGKYSVFASGIVDNEVESVTDDTVFKVEKSVPALPAPLVVAIFGLIVLLKKGKQFGVRFMEETQDR